jgi:hypothetical protein
MVFHLPTQQYLDLAWASGHTTTLGLVSLCKAQTLIILLQVQDPKQVYTVSDLGEVFKRWSYAHNDIEFLLKR